VDLFKRYGRRCKWFAASSSMVVLINRTSDGDQKNEQTNLASYSGPFRKTISESEAGVSIWVGRRGGWILECYQMYHHFILILDLPPDHGIVRIRTVDPSSTRFGTA
jgi:hypothetical protein